MNERPDRLNELLGQLAPPDPPHDLEAQVLAGAKEALAREAGRDVWTRIWESRPIRLAWAATVLALVICNVGVSVLLSSPRPSSPQAATTGRDGRGELSAVGRLPRLDENARPLIGTQAYRVLEHGETDRTPPPRGKGKESAS